MKWHLIESGFATGEENMAKDINLAKSVKPDEAIFRLFRWKPYCISLGYNQNFEEIDNSKAARDNIDVVKRPTGGRAILHSEEITYSVILPLSKDISPKQIYRKISNALINGLIYYDPSIRDQLELENSQPDLPTLLKQKEGTLCFASTAKSEVKFDNKKIIGSAQRKFANSLLQHGSILVGQFHKKLPDYITGDLKIRQMLKRKLDERTIELETILNKPVNYKDLSDCLKKGFESTWEIQFNSR